MCVQGSPAFGSWLSLNSQLGLAWVQLQGSANPSHKVILKQNTNPSFLTCCGFKHFVLPLQVTYLREAEFYMQFTGWSCSVVSKSPGWTLADSTPTVLLKQPGQGSKGGAVPGPQEKRQPQA